MTVLKSTLKLSRANSSSLSGALASTAWIILNSKFLNSDEVELNLTSLHHGKENPDSHIVCISRDSELRTIIDQVNSTAYLHGSSKLWHLSLKLPLVYLDGALSRSTQLVIVETENSGWTWKELSIYKSMPDLLLVVNPSDSNINFELFTFTTSISITRSQRLFQQFSHIVNQLECLPTAHVGDLSLVGPKDVADIERWNENPVEPVLDCVHWAIERQARERPEAEAVCAWDGSLNYKEISFASNRLAKRLVAFGVGPEVLVPVCFEKSIWAIVAMVAILKAGGGCVPLNPGHPRSRHQVILDDIKAPVIIASESYRSLAHELHSDVVIVSREAIDALDSEDSEVYLDKVAVGPYNPAFAVFTSGSTGQPKGIVIEHSAICTSIYNHGRVMRFGSQTRTIQFAAYTFDDSFSDIFTTLTFGGCICVPSERDRLNDLAGSIVRMNANHACLTVTVASQLRPSDVPTLDTLIVGGESVTAKVVQQWAEHVYLINSYGPAEASIFCSANSDLSSTDDPINIGVGVGCLLHITDTEDHNSLLPIGAVGELLIEGPILARCYIRNDDKTNASFITNPAWVSIVDGAPRRFYKTGDLARYQENGTIQVLGRKDTQVKVHGQRIELGEIEHHLRNEIMNCKEAAVDVLRPTTASEPAPSVLVAFLQIADSKESHSGISEQKPLEVMHEFPDLVEERLKQLLPSYMIPSVYIRMDEPPLMVSGKLDRKKLRTMASSLKTEELLRYGETNGLSSPETPKQKKLQALWAEVLGVDIDLIRLESSFFRLSGDSVAAMRLVATARDVGVDITVQKIFQYPTLREQSAIVEFAQVATSELETVKRFDMLGDVNRIVESALATIREHDSQIDGDAILDIYPCSPLQEGVMALSARNPGSYVAQMAWKLSDDVHMTRFKSAWDFVIQSRPILRTRIVQAKGDPTLWQAVVRDQAHWVEVHGDIESYLASDKQIPMILGSRLARFAIVRSESDTWFVWTLHHAIFDDVSQRLLLRSVEQAFHNRPLEAQLDFNVFIKYINRTDTRASAEFWKKLLDNPPPPSFPMLSKVDYLPLAIRGATWAILLAQYSESDDIVFGCAVNGRSAALDGVRTIPGPTFATVPLRVTVDRDNYIHQFLSLLQQQYVDMIPHEHVGLQRIARWVPEARVACSFQSLLVVQAADHASEGDTLLGASEILGSSVGLLTYALTIECRPTSNSLNIQFHFDSNILHIIQVERLSRQFEHILRQLNNINMSERVKIESLELVPEDDIRVLSQWNSGNSDDQVDELMHQGFYRHLEVQPSSPAVEDYDSSLTYAELESLSNRLAHNLVAQFGIQTGHFVPLCAEKSTLTIVAALAILKIGGALTMLDPSLPIDRLKQMVNISKGCFILYTATTAHLRFNIPITPVILDRQFLDSLQTRDHFQVAVDPSDPACILFTSGSTGNPKGTVISHSAWSSGTKKATRFGGMEELRPLRTLQFAGMSFDICLFEIMPTLSVGGCVCVLPESERTSEGVVRAINRLRVNWAFMVPTFASLIETSYLPTLRTLHFAGEAAPPSLFSHFPKHVRLIQSYGPSECTPVTFVSTHLDPKVPTNVGRAIVGTGWIVDPLDHRRLVPIGAIGELLLAGPNVGGGYLGDSDKTAQSFIEPPPWTKYFPSVQQGRHMYLTGDLFRYDVNGTFIFLGRKDTQIKLRGQRMELGEIEHHLRLLVQEAKAIVAECITPAGQDRKLLVAFLCFSTADDAEADKGTLLPANTLDKIDLPAVVHRAAAFLPRYMVPTVFLPIQQLPFMRVSRKIDRHALRSLGSKLDATALRAYTIQQQDKKLPHSSAELEMRALFASVLQVDEHSIGTNDSFLMLGGDSIDAMRLVSLAGTTNVSLTVGQVLQNPILEDLAKLAVKNIDNEGLDIPIARWELLRKPHSADSIQAEAFVQCQLPPGIRIEDAYPCTPLQEGLFALSIARHGAYFAQHVFVAPPSVDSKSLMDAWQRLFDSLNIFRTRIIQLSTSELVQIVTREPLEWTTGDDLGAYLQRDQSVQFGLGQRLSRFALIQPAGSDSPVVVWSTHHSLYDGFSIQLIMAGLEAALDSGFCDLAAQNADFRQYIRYICNTDLDTSREYWKDQFSNGCFVQFPPVSRNETDRVERDLISGTIPYSQTLTNVTSSSVIRAAWALTLSRYTGSTDVIFGATVSGRDMAVPNISKIIGPVMSTVPVRVTIDYAKSVRHFVEKVQQQAVEMIAFQHFGLQKIAHSSSDAAAASRFQNLLVVQPSSFDREKANLITHHFADENDVQTHTYPMVIDCDIKDSSVEIKVLYNSHQIEPSQMHRILRLFGGFIQAIAQAAASDTTVSQLLRAHQPDIETLHAWNAKVPPAVEKCVHQCIPFKARASQLAIRSWDGDVTYGELDALSTKIAHHLVSLGVGPDVLVPMCFRKSLWAMVTTFGVLKAGGAPVFLDKEWSIDRLTNMIEFLDAELLLTSAQLFQDAKPKPRVTHIVEIDQIFVDAITSNAPLPEVQPYNLGFATFTSGSTGTPKCVLVEHRNLLTIEHLYVTVGEFRPNARVLQFASYVFDAMTKDFLATPLHGGTLYIPSEEDRMNNLVEYMRANQITQATLTPTIGSLFGPSDVPSLDVLILAGEKLTAENLATWAAAVHLNNGYGPSEACGRNTCRTGLTTDSDPGSIGHAIGCICWIADPDDHNLLVPIGAVGEILIEGPTVTRGYLKNPEKTADVFISPPEWIPADRRDSRNRLYKTGDLARLESNGSLTILGRKDSQVKLHGQRIELEEIERQFQVHLPPDIGIVVEMVSSKADGGTLLVGFLHDKTLNWGNCELQFMDPRLTALAELDIETVLNAVGQTLTSYMIPRVFMVISRIPLLPSAKTDRKILRELYANTDPSLLASHLISGSRRIQAPTSHRQERLRATISNVLRLDESFIGLNHNFLQLGGDSITAMRLVSAAKAENIGLTVTGILQSANLEELDCISIDIEEQQQEQVNPFELVECSDLSQLVAEAATQCKIAADLIEDIYPCTPLQEALMALSTQQEDDYIARHQFQLPEDVDFFKLQFAWNTVSQKLPILRTRIVQTSMGLFQVIVKSSIGNFADNSTNFPMRLGTALNRVILDQQQKVLTWISHHATYDGISIRLIMKLVNQVYREIPLDPMDFTDYRIFINYIRQLSFDASKSFWASQLADVSPEWFPSGGSSITHVDINGRLQTVNTLAAPLTSEIIRASWGLVLAAYTSSDEVVFGTILSGRTASVQNIDRIAGPTIATVPIRVRIDDGEKIEAFLTRLQEQAMEMIPHQHFGLQNIRRISDDVRHACDFHNLLVIHAMEEAFEEASSVLQAHGSLTPFNMNTYPLVLEVHILPNGYSLDVSYDRSITSEVQIQRLVRQFDNVVSHLLCCRSQPSSVVSDIQVISSADREELWLWNNAIPETVEDSLHHLIEQRVQLAPDAEAIVSWDGRMTYFELDQASSILAHEIFSRDKSVGSFVPLFFEKSLWTVVAMLAVLKAGKAFAFLDPSYPVERLRQVTSILTPHLAISSHIHQESCRKLVPDTIVLGPDTVRTSKKMVNPPTVVVRSSDPICAIFTSGTTGKPKGAILSHRSYVSSNMQHAKTLSMDSTTRMLQFGSCSFDAIIFEVLTTLLVGGCVCVPEEKYRNIDIDVEITRMKANWALFTPSFASLLSPEQVPTLKALILVGEAANVQLIQTWSNKLSLHNGYGPSECSIFSTLNTNIDESTSPMNVGRASSGALWIVKPTNVDCLVPIGAPGELLLEGPNIGEGYINDPVRTQAVFLERIPSWFSRKDYNGFIHPAKFYLTGDIVKYAPDGSILFIRRKDNQTKIRGQRVELGDIENHLATVADLGHHMVLIPSSGLLHKNLVAVFSVEKTTAFQNIQESARLTVLHHSLGEKVRSLIDVANKSLSTQLPSHMVPNFWVPVESLPVLSSGKLDRQRVCTWLEGLDEQTWEQLIALAATPAESEENLTNEESCLRDLWHQVLNVDLNVINSRSAFLQLGGDSISAMQLMSKARDAGLYLSMLNITKSKSLRELAISAIPITNSTNMVKGFETEPTETLFDLSPVQKLYFSITPEGNNEFEQSILLKCSQNLSASVLSNTVNRIVEHHSQLRARYTQIRGCWMQSISKYNPTDSILRIHQDSISDIPRIVTECKRRLDFKNGPVFLAELIETRDEQYLFLVAHHLSIDLMSWRIILQDLEDLSLGRVQSLSRSLSFQAWVSLQDQYCQQLDPVRLSQDVEPLDAGYWGINNEISNTYSDIVQRSFRLDKSTSSSLLQQSNSVFTSKPVDIFLGAAITSFSHIFGDRSLPTVLLEGHGREPWSSSVDILRTIGWFTTLFPVSLAREEAANIVTAVRSVKDRRNHFQDNGFAAFACSQLLPQSSSTTPEFPAEITLNFLGQYQQLEKDDALFKEAEIDLSSQNTSSQERFSLINITVLVRNGQLGFDVSYHNKILKQHLITRWIDEYVACLQEAAAILPTLSPTYTPSDFPLLRTSHEELQVLLEDRLPSLGIDIEAVDDLSLCSPTQIDMVEDEENAIGHHVTRLNFEVTVTTSREAIDLDRFSTAFAELVKRHPILRTVFIPPSQSDGQFIQVVLKQFTPDIIHATVDEFSNEPEYTDTVYKKFYRGEPPYQLTCCHVLARNMIFLSIDISHTLIDGASMAILIHDWNLAYQGKLPNGIPPSFQSLIRLIQYRASQGPTSYWTQHLQGIQPCLLPCHRSDLIGERQQRYVRLKLPAIHILQKVCQLISITIPNLFHSIWSIVLHLATKSNHVVFGYLVSGRDVPLAGIEDAVGPYFNLLVSQYKINPEQTIRTVLQTVQATMTERLPFQNFSWPEMRHVVGFAAKTPVFNTLINIHRFAPLKSREKKQLNFTARNGYDPLAYDVELSGKIDNDVIKLGLVYWSTSLTDEVASGLAASIERVLNRTLLDLDSSIGDLY